MPQPFCLKESTTKLEFSMGGIGIELKDAVLF